jgi:hypothetical protein
VYKESTFFKKGSKTMHQLTFRICGTHSSLYVAAAQPYTYTELNAALHVWQGQCQRTKYIKRSTLCKTLAGNVVDVLTITDPEADSAQGTSESSQCFSPQLHGNRPWIVVCGRVHPSESNSSWFVHGLIDFLSDPCSVVAQQLRRQFVWLVIPMLNPDGVICGNSRCNLAGLDLNRCWADPSETCPTIYHAKALLQRLCPLTTITLFLDVHGHSRKRGAFFYGNRRQIRSATGQLLPFATAPVGPEVKVPQMFAAISPVFSLQDCTFTISRNKLGTARCVMFNEFQLVNSFTLEISMFAAASMGEMPLSGALHASDSSTTPLISRDAIDGFVDETLKSMKTVVPHAIPQHLEKDDFTKLSRDFATSLIASDLSWMIDPSGGIMKMTLSPSLSCMHAANRKNEATDFTATAAWYSERQIAIQWLTSRGIHISGDEKQNVDSRLLFECKSIQGPVEIQRDLPLFPVNPSCTIIMKLLLGSARAHQELQGEAPNTRSSVQSFIMHQLRTQIQQTDVVQLQVTLRAVADWMDFLMKINRQQQPKLDMKGADVGCASQNWSELSATAINLASLATARHCINDGLHRLQCVQAGGCVGNSEFILNRYSNGDAKLLEERKLKREENVATIKPNQASISNSAAGMNESAVFAAQRTGIQDECSLIFALQSSSSGAPAASQASPRQQSDNCVKPWSLSFKAPDEALIPTRITSSISASLDGSISVVGRMRCATACSLLAILTVFINPVFYSSLQTTYS